MPTAFAVIRSLLRIARCSSPRSQYERVSNFFWYGNKIEIKSLDYRRDDWSNIRSVPMTTDNADTRERILEAGSEAIVAKSYNGCGLNEILGAAGVPKGSFYHYFKSKEGFGVAVIEQSADGHSQRLRQYFTDRSRPPLDRLRGFYAVCRDYYAESSPTRQCLIAKLALETAHLSEPMRAAIKCGYDEWSLLHAKVLREAQAEGELDATANPETLANAIMHAWEGATIRMQIDLDVTPLNEFVETVLERLIASR